MDTQRIQDEVILTRKLRDRLREASQGYSDDKIFLVFDRNTWSHCWPLVEGFRQVRTENILVVEAGEEHKTLDGVVTIWSRFGELGIDRMSLIVNIGGGMVTDLGAFAASTLKRGIAFINIPTTLLAMVDASVGGKSGINFRGFKNEIGVIRMPEKVFIHLPFLKTLGRDELLSGFAELLKAGLIADAGLWKELLTADVSDPVRPEWEEWIWRAIRIKQDIVAEDLNETGARKALNFGHTIGHAIESESLAVKTPVLHGFAVAWGMVIESRISATQIGLPWVQQDEIEKNLIRIFGALPDLSGKVSELISWMRYDKKNSGNQIHFTLLPSIGSFEVNHTLPEGEISRYLHAAGHFNG